MCIRESYPQREICSLPSPFLGQVFKNVHLEDILLLYKIEIKRIAQKVKRNIQRRTVEGKISPIIPFVRFLSIFQDFSLPFDLF